MAKKMNENAIAPELTAEELAALEAKKLEAKEKAKAKKAAEAEKLSKLLALAKMSGDASMIALVQELETKAKVERAPRTKTVTVQGQPRANVLDFVKEVMASGTAHEDEIWAKYKLGRIDMKWKLADALKKAPTPAERLWISFNPETGMYVNEGQSELPPEGFVGFVPEGLRKGVIPTVDTEVAREDTM